MSEMEVFMTLVNNNKATFAGPFLKEGVDGTEKFPKYHKKIFETDHAKVVRVFIPPNSKEEPHTHMTESWMFTDVPTTIKVYLVDMFNNEKCVFTRDQPQKSPARPIAEKMGKEPFHYVKNTEDFAYLATRIEIKERPATPEKRLHWGPMTNLPLPSKEELWDFAVKKRVNVFMCDREGFVIGNAGTDFKIHQMVQGKLNPEKETPLDDLQGRPPVWHLKEKTSYAIFNEKDKEEQAYLLEV